MFYWVALFIGTHIPMERLAFNPGSTDKFAHVGAFTVLAALLATTWRLSAGRLHVRQLLWVWIIVVLYGAIEETTQPLMNRIASLLDWLADAIGAALGIAIYWRWLSGWLNTVVPDSEVTSDDDRPRTWRRYSLRTLFMMMTAVAAGCYWMVLPTINAQRFVQAIQERNYAAAERIFISKSEAFPGSFKQYRHFKSWPTIAPMTLSDIWRGERRIGVGIHYGDEGAMATCAADIRAYRSGLQLEMLFP